MLHCALKEWAALCLALGRGLQSLLLRKGGILETGSGFQVTQRRFWLLPTYLHQSRAGLAPPAWPLLEQADELKPPPGQLLLHYFAEVTASYHLDILEQVERLEPHHLLTPETAVQRFTYRQPGLEAMVLRVHAVPTPHLVPNCNAYDGCKSWVTLEQPLDTQGAVPVLSDEAFAAQYDRIRIAITGGGKP
jgi:hypothetical protein